MDRFRYNCTPFGNPVTLNEGNRWQYTWRELDDSIAWTVEEMDVPDGYRREIRAMDDGWVIENIGTAPGADAPPQTRDAFPAAALWIMCLLSLIGAPVSLLRSPKYS